MANELATINHYMTVGREYASLESVRAFTQVLEEVGCDHLEKFEVKDAERYCNASPHAHEAGLRFYSCFWRPGGQDLGFFKPRCLVERCLLSSFLGIRLVIGLIRGMLCRHFGLADC
jgi:hypothetical protein